MSELKYKGLIDDFLRDKVEPEEFVEKFIKTWQDDRETDYDIRFRRLIDRIFSSCACYDKDPNGQFDISEDELRNEVWLLGAIWWGVGMYGVGLDQGGD